MSYLLIALADARKQTCAACPCRSAEEDLGLHCHLPSSLRYRTRMSQTWCTPRTYELALGNGDREH